MLELTEIKLVCACVYVCNDNERKQIRHFCCNSQETGYELNIHIVLDVIAQVRYEQVDGWP